MKFVNDFGVAPSRGTAKSVGLDFCMPDPRTWGDKQISNFCKYLLSKKYFDLEKAIRNSTDKRDESAAVLLYISHVYHKKASYDQWREWFDGDSIRVKPGESVLVPTGIRTLFSKNTYGEFENKSGMGSKGWQVGAKVVDEDYTGYVHINLHNVSDHDNTVTLGQKLSQLIERHVVTYDAPGEISSEDFFKLMEDSERGDGAFASTGV